VKPIPPNNRGKHFKPPVIALVLHSVRADGRTADLWRGRKAVILQLSCGHLLRRLVERQFLVGERVRCRKCEQGAPVQLQMWPMEIELTP